METKITCEICHEDLTNGDYRIETIDNKTFYYCLFCFNRHSNLCDICDDRYVHLSEHKNSYRS